MAAPTQQLVQPVCPGARTAVAPGLGMWQPLQTLCRSMGAPMIWRKSNMTGLTTILELCSLWDHDEGGTHCDLQVRMVS